MLTPYQPRRLHAYSKLHMNLTKKHERRGSRRQVHIQRSHELQRRRSKSQSRQQTRRKAQLSKALQVSVLVVTPAEQAEWITRKPLPGQSWKHLTQLPSLGSAWRAIPQGPR